MSEDSAIVPLVKREPKLTIDDLEQRCYWLSIEILERKKKDVKT